MAAQYVSIDARSGDLFSMRDETSLEHCELLYQPPPRSGRYTIETIWCTLEVILRW